MGISLILPIGMFLFGQFTAAFSVSNSQSALDIEPTDQVLRNTKKICKAKTKKGVNCQNPVWNNSEYCHRHRNYDSWWAQLLENLQRIKRPWWVILATFLFSAFVNIAGIYPVLTGPISYLDYRYKVITDKIEPVESDAAAIDNIYGMVEKQILFQYDCPDNLNTDEWRDFRAWIKKLDFAPLADYKTQDLKAYRRLFSDTLTDPPTTKFDCGYMRGELLLTLRNSFADYELTMARIKQDGKHPGFIRGVTEIMEWWRIQYLMLLGFEPERFEQVSDEKQLFVELLAVWMVMFFDEDRTPTVEKAQGMLLFLDPEEVHESAYYEPLASVHADLLRLSHAINEQDDSEMGLYASRAAMKLADMALSIITDEEATYLGGNTLPVIIQTMRDVAGGEGLGELEQLRQMIKMLQAAKPQ